MRKAATTSADLVPLGERLRILLIYRLLVVALIATLWTFDPSSSAVPTATAAAVIAGYLLASVGLEGLWRALRPPGSFLLGILLIIDGAFLAWASYGTAGLASPVGYLVLLQLTTVSLIASWRTGVKLVVWSSLLLIAAYYAQRTGILAHLGNPHVQFGGGYREVVIRASVYALVALVTATFAAINERELRRRRYDLEALATLALHLEVADDAAAVAATLLEDIADAFGYERAAVIELRQGQLTALAARGLPSGDALTWRAIDPPAAPLVTQALERGATARIARSEISRDALLSACVPSSHAIVVPLHTDRPLGVLIVEHDLRHGSRVERRVITMLERFCSHASLTLGTVQLLAHMRDRASTDSLTGLANRRALDEALARACAQAEREGLALSVALFDIDHFKSLNDTHGHQLGDRVLQLVGRTLAQQTRAGDVAARFGGEEFLVLMPGAELDGGAEITRRLCSEITRRIRATITHTSGELTVTASAGVAQLGLLGSSPKELVVAADQALYNAKRWGRNRVVTAGTDETPHPSEPTRPHQGGGPTDSPARDA